ncbi:MAG: MATE family efflux transporter [Treponema sp.]|nr:MATE family efflux transporter [Treponema sp.]
MQKKSITDMTAGRISPLMIRFALPLIVGNLFQQLYNTVDCIIVGNYVGKEALAAIGSTGSLINSVIGFFMGLAAGGSVVISQNFGARNIPQVRRTLHTMMAGSAIAGIFLIFFGHAASPVILRLMSTPEDVFDMANEYLAIYFSGAFFQLLYNVGAGILRALGDSTRPLYFLVVSSIVNVILDFLFVVGFKLGICGAAYATIISQFVSMVLVLFVMLRTKECYRLSVKELRIHPGSLRRVLQQGLPGGIQMSITAFSNVFVQGYINHFGSACMAGWSCFNKIDQVSLLPIQSISLAVTTFTGQNYGAKNMQRVKTGARVALLLAFAWTAMLIFVFELLPRPLISMFNRDEGVLYYGMFFLRVGAPFYIFRILNQVFAGVLRGLGNALAPTVVMLSSFVAFRQLYLFTVTSVTDSFVPVSLAYPVGWCMCGILMVSAYFRQKKLLNKIDGTAHTYRESGGSHEL